MTDTKSDYLSKSLFLRGLQCHKSLYLHKFSFSELRDEIPPSREAIFQSGREIGRFAQELFPGGVEIEYEGYTPLQQLMRTGEEIRKGTEILYEPAFSFDGVFMKADIMRKTDEGSGNLRSQRHYKIRGCT